jgi:hypothetical protein
MSFEIAGTLGVPMPLAQTFLNEALGQIYDEQIWSFQLGEAGWITPGLLFSTGTQSKGTITTTSYGTTIVGDATAAVAWVAYSGLPLLTQCQIRSPYYSLYNIVAFDGVNTLTIDRPWTEPFGAAQSYMIYQAYFPAPVSDWKRFFEIRDTTNNANVDYWSYSRRDLARMDAERVVFGPSIPTFIVPYEVDNRTNSATLGYMLFEMWPHPLSVLPFTMSYRRRGNLLSLPANTVPYPFTEDMVKWRAKEAAYLWKESQKGDGVKRGEGADWKFLAGAARAEYKKIKKDIARTDEDMVQLFFDRFRRDSTEPFGEPYATLNSQLNIGRM